ncbi:hypothetical protein [Candidatus Nitrosocosmicus sp. SS]|jgi:hypothetical protein|uniref:hypothetical protein n=1 Tax=Candidatus Nitrosocosmicus agrestis TaxID=2563600 RepID=UPI0012B62767|nr:hypothetical protein [Candidatus Nitrosocosmicus sp. SS]
MFGLFSTIIATSQTSLVLAKKPSDPNCFGEAALDFGKSRQMGNILQVLTNHDKELVI